MATCQAREHTTSKVEYVAAYNNVRVGNVIRFDMLLLGAAVHEGEHGTRVYYLKRSDRQAELSYDPTQGTRAYYLLIGTPEYINCSGEAEVMISFWQHWRQGVSKTGK